MSISLHNRESCGRVQQQCAALRALPAASPRSLEEALDPAVLCDTCGDWNDRAP